MKCPVPQKWIGSSVALGFDIGQMPKRGEEEKFRQKIIVSIFDWGRSELNTIEKNAALSDEVLTYYEEDCMWYPGRILSIDPGSGYLVKWDVPEDGLEEIRVKAEHLRMALIPVRDLQIGQKFTGIVYELNQFGAFVDIGAEEHGLLPIRQMSKKWFDSPEEVLEEGQAVDVWVSRKKDGHFSVTRVEDLIETDLGQEVRVRMLSVDVDSGRIILSMKGDRSAVPLKDYYIALR
eukprot:symbB.v1.2.026299.t1/scaffold2616.1/size74813/3